MSRDYTVGDTIYLYFTTRAFATGIPTVLSGTPVVAAYENDSITQITAGITLGVDHDGVVGLNLLTIVATGANGFESGKDYALVITTGTVGGVSVVGEVVGDFTLGRSAAAVDLANGTDGLGAIKTDSAAILVDSAAILVDTGTTLQAELDGIQADTEDIQSRIPAALVGGRVDANVGAISGSVEAADDLEASAETIITGAAVSGTLLTNQMTTDITVSVADQFNGRIIIFKEDTTTVALRGQATDITDTETASSRLTFTALTTAPVVGDTFVIV